MTVNWSIVAGAVLIAAPAIFLARDSVRAFGARETLKNFGVAVLMTASFVFGALLIGGTP